MSLIHRCSDHRKFPWHINKRDTESQKPRTVFQNQVPRITSKTRAAGAMLIPLITEEKRYAKHFPPVPPSLINQGDGNYCGCQLWFCGYVDPYSIVGCRLWHFRFEFGPLKMRAAAGRQGASSEPRFRKLMKETCFFGINEVTQRTNRRNIG